MLNTLKKKLPGVTDVAFENHCDPLALIRFDIQGKDIGSYLLETKEMGIPNYSFVSAFRFAGQNTLRPEGEAERFLNRFEGGLRKLSSAQKLRIHFRSFAEDETAQSELSALLKTDCSTESKFFIEAERKHVRQLTEAGERQKKEIILFAYYNVGSFGSDARGWLEKAIGLIAQASSKFGGKSNNSSYEHFQKLLAEGYRSGLRPWISRLTGMGLRPEALSTQELWLELATRFNHRPSKTIPHCLTLSDETGHLELSEEINSPLALMSKAMQGERGRSACPQGGREFAVVKDKLVAAMVLEEKPNAWISSDHMLSSVWEPISDIPDCEVIVEMEPGNRRTAYHLLGRTGKAGIKSAQSAAGKDLSTKALGNIESATDAQRRINSGVSPIYLSMTVLIHRNTQEELAKTCNDLSSNFLNGLIIRDRNIALDLWRRSLPVVAAQLVPDGRRMQYLSDEVPGLTPLICPYAADQKGLEFVTMAGQRPLHIDIYSKTIGILIFGETRSSKSVVAADLFTKMIARGSNVIVIDATREDGASTYTELAKFYGKEGAYFDVGSQSNNLFQPPDFSHRKDLSGIVKSQRIESYREFLVKALTVMVMGEVLDPLTKRVRTLLLQSITPFFRHPDIKARYERAFACGLGSDEWMRMPTLFDFVDFFDSHDFDISGESALITEAKTTILLELRGWLSGRIGKSISAPSTLDFDSAKFTVFALSNVSDDTEAAVLALSAQSLALRKALQLNSCLVAIEEAPILLKYKGLAEIVGAFCSNGQKTGIKPVIISQTAEAITDSVIASQITNNLKVRLIGCITNSSIISFSKLLNYDAQVLAVNSEQSFFVNPQKQRSSWLVDVNSTLVHCYHYPNPQLLTTVANNPPERAFRDRILKGYQNKYAGIAEATKQYIPALQSGDFQEKPKVLEPSNVVELRHAS